MKRRNFLCYLVVVVSSRVLTFLVFTASVTASSPKNAGPNEPRVFMYDDGRHAASLYQFEPPITPSDLTFNVDQLVDSGVDTLVYWSGLEGGVVLYDSKVAPKWGDNVKRWTHPVWYRASRNIQQLIDAGHDPLKILCERCHKKGIWFIASDWVNLSGGDRETYGGQGRKSDFVYDNPQFQVGSEDDPRAKLVQPTRFNFLHSEVRYYRFQIFEELLARYSTDGIELNLAMDIPLCKFSQTAQLAPVLTEWIRKLRAVADQSEEDQGRRKRIYARIPAQPEAWKLLGYDIPTWVNERLVDGLICLPSELEAPIDQHADFSSVLQLTQGTDCRVLIGFSNLLGRQFEQYATQPMIWAAAANAYDQGADGFGLAVHHWSPNGWPWVENEYKTLRLIGHSEMLATADKLYRARSQMGGQSRETWIPGGALDLPRTLVEGRPVEVSLRIADRLDHWQAQGRVELVRLRVRITNIEPSLNDVHVELNGQQLPNSLLQLSDFTYRLWKNGALYPYGYVFEFDLSPRFYPKVGNNVVRVTLAKRDPMIDTRFEIYDVDCSIRYLPHRRFQREPVEY